MTTVSLQPAAHPTQKHARNGVLGTGVQPSQVDICKSGRRVNTKTCLEPSALKACLLLGRTWWLYKWKSCVTKCTSSFGT